MSDAEDSYVYEKRDKNKDYSIVRIHNEDFTPQELNLWNKYSKRARGFMIGAGVAFALEAAFLLVSFENYVSYKVEPIMLERHYMASSADILKSKLKNPKNTLESSNLSADNNTDLTDRLTPSNKECIDALEKGVKSIENSVEYKQVEANYNRRQQRANYGIYSLGALVILGCAISNSSRKKKDAVKNRRVYASGGGGF